ncbi:hypothetical protein BSKO_06976 [Bryopsis sp. KO-2023]|nr:hypothetical protein BSKO_06976 [Bryopsis sp. KO-2023]
MSRSRKEPKFLQLFRIAATPCEIKDDFEKLLAGASQVQGDGQKDVLLQAAGLSHSRRLRRAPAELSEFTARSTTKRITAGRKRRFADEGPSEPPPARKASKKGGCSQKTTVDCKADPIKTDMKRGGKSMNMAPCSTTDEQMGGKDKLAKDMVSRDGEKRKLVMEVHKTGNRVQEAKRGSGQSSQQSGPSATTRKGVAPILAAKDVPPNAIGGGLVPE